MSDIERIFAEVPAEGTPERGDRLSKLSAQVWKGLSEDERKSMTQEQFTMRVNYLEYQIGMGTAALEAPDA